MDHPLWNFLHKSFWSRGFSSLIVFLLFVTRGSSFQCDVTADPIYHGSFVDCSNRNLSRHDLGKLGFDKVVVTSLNISGNNFEFFPNCSFCQFPELKQLICLNCALNRLDVDSFKGLVELELLNLSNNNLKLRLFAFPKSCFQRVQQLKELYIDFNNNNGEVESYSPYIDIFSSLPELTHLAIDSFSKLRIGAEFVNLTKLLSLKINCFLLNRIENDSLEGFQNSSVRAFELVLGADVYAFEIGLDVFQHLPPNISYLSLDSLRIGNQRALRMMKPLVGQKIETVKLTTIYSAEFGNFEQKVQDGLVSVKSMEFLGKICVNNFIWLDSHVFSVESDAFLSPLWQDCLTQFVIQSNELIAANLILFFKLRLLKRIELLAYLTRGDDFLNEFVNGYHYHYSGAVGMTLKRRKASNLYLEDFSHVMQLSTRQDNKNKGKHEPFNDERTEHLSGHDVNLSNYEISHEEPSILIDAHSEKTDNILRGHRESKRYNSGEKTDANHENKITENAYTLTDFNETTLYHHNSNISLGKILIFVPPTCKSFIIDGMHYLHDRYDFSFGPNSLTTLMATNSLEVTILHAKFYGLDSVSTINLKGSKIDIILDFFDTFPSLRNLVLRGTAVRPKWLQANCKKLISTITNLQYLDLADNFLQRLAHGTFHTNRELRHLCFAKNRFSSIPFSLDLTPKLEILDLRENSFTELTTKDRAAIDNHILQVPHFKILFEDNELSCTCSALPFIFWLQKNLVHFDHNGNYSCISEDGSLSQTAEFQDIDAFWRKCQGKDYLFVSLIVACVLTLTLIALKNQARIVHKIMQVIVPGFRFKRREDFATDVCIGYADQDATFVRNVLLSYLEDQWHLSTFVHHRDLRQDQLLMSSYLGDSWKCLLLLSENFLYHYEMGHHVMKVASFFVGPTDPKRLIVLVEAEVEHQIPSYIVQVVNEDNVMVVPSLQGPLDRNTVEFLRQRLTS